MSNCCCRPQYAVTAATTTDDVTALTVTPLLPTGGTNFCIKLCIPLGILPANTNQITLTDTATTATVLTLTQQNGNYVRSDSLRRFICKNSRSCCKIFEFTVFIGDDPEHATLCNRICPSAAVAPAGLT